MANLLDEASILLSATAYNNGSMLAVKPENGDGDFTFSRNSSATRVNAQGLVENVASNLPRIDYTDGCGSWLLEPQSTNLITQSENFSDASWRKSATIVGANSIISADGTQNASLIQSTQTGSAYVAPNNLTLTIGNTYTFSCFAKKGNNDWIRLAHISSGGTGCWFDLENGVVGTVNSQSATIEDYGNGWYRCTNTFIATATTNLDNAFIGICDANGSTTVGIVGKNDYLWGAQLEQNSFATSLIPTQGAISTRLADIANNSGNASLINSNEGVLYAEISALANDGTNRVITLSKSSDWSNRTFLRYDASANSITYRYLVNGSIKVNLVHTLSNATILNKIACKWELNNFKLYVNGLNVGQDLSGSVISAGSLNKLNFNDGLGTNKFYGKNKALAVYKTALTDAQLTLLTTI